MGRHPTLHFYISAVFLDISFQNNSMKMWACLSILWHSFSRSRFRAHIYNQGQKEEQRKEMTTLTFIQMYWSTHKTRLTEGRSYLAMWRFPRNRKCWRHSLIKREIRKILKTHKDLIPFLSLLFLHLLVLMKRVTHSRILKKSLISWWMARCQYETSTSATPRATVYHMLQAIVDAMRSGYV